MYISMFIAASRADVCVCISTQAAPASRPSAAAKPKPSDLSTRSAATQRTSLRKTHREGVR